MGSFVQLSTILLLFLNNPDTERECHGGKAGIICSLGDGKVKITLCHMALKNV